MGARIRERWNGFWFVEGPPQALAVFRILMATYWFVHWIICAPYVRLLFSRDGMHFPFVYYPSAGLDPVGELYGWLTQPAPPWAAWLLYLVLMGSIVCMLIGFHTRLAHGLYALLFTYYYMLYLHPLNSSFGRMTFIITVFLIFSPCGEALSIDARRKRARGIAVPEAVPLWTQRAICLQTTFIYFGTALFKVTSKYWDRGEMVATSLMGDWATPVGHWLVTLPFSWGVYDLVVLSTIAFEMWAGLLLWNPRHQRLIFVIGTLFHLQIAVTLGIWQFLFLPMTYVLFVDPQRFRAAFERRFPAPRVSSSEAA